MLAAECARYSKLLAEAPIYIVLLGVGENGRLASNDPPVAGFHDAAAVKWSSELVCRQQQVNVGCFAEVAHAAMQMCTLLPAMANSRVLERRAAGNAATPTTAVSRV